MVDPAPNHLRVRMYNVGFGDCFLLSFTYDATRSNPTDQPTDRHILIDFGSTSRARSRLSMKAVADYIAADCCGRLDAIVVTHRHKDHLAGFATAASSKIIAGLRPGLVIRPWTEDPKLAADAGHPRDAGLTGGTDRAAEQVLLDALRGGEVLAQQIVARANMAGRGGQTDLVQLADDEISNADAVAELNRLSDGDRGEYLFANRQTRLAKLLPGVRLRVLGPPKPSQWSAVAKQAEESEEYWLSSKRQTGRLFAATSATRAVPVGTSRWIMDRMRSDEQRQLMSLVRWLDDAMNNTSLILLLETGGHTLLFGGDAQIENWGWALAQARKDEALRTLLGSVDLYKVGHHGSRNGTPISLYRMWAAQADAQPFIAMMSTKLGVHGDRDGTVPSSNLVKALRARGALLSTDDADADWIQVEASLPDGQYEITRARIP